MKYHSHSLQIYVYRFCNMCFGVFTLHKEEIVIIYIIICGDQYVNSMIRISALLEHANINEKFKNNVFEAIFKKKKNLIFFL